MNSKACRTFAARLAGAVLALAALTLSGCSAIELHQQLGSATAAEQPSTAAAADSTVAAQAAALAEARATAQSLAQSATQAAATISALASPPVTVTVAVAAAPPPPASAAALVYGSVPIDSDRLNIIAALAFDADGQLLAATRAGEIYAMPDSDGDGSADETRLIFADRQQQLGQVSGLIARSDGLLLLNGGRLSLLRDSDGDGAYDSVMQLSEQMPAEQSPLQASNGIVAAPDGRLFSVDINAGEVFRIVMRE